MADFLAWSYSRLKAFKECPRSVYHQNAVRKGHPDYVGYMQTAQKDAGLAVDEALTKRIAEGVPLPPQYAPFEPVVQLILAAPGAKLAQAQFALDQNFRPCAYKDWDNAWVRVIYDVAIINGAHGFLGDWKNGNIWIDEDQNRLFATVGFHIFPEIEVFDTSYIWLKTGVTTDARYTRRELPDLWQTFIPDVERMQASYKTNHWPATPKRGAKSCAYCPVNRAGKCREAQGGFKG